MSATALHWMDENKALEKITLLLRPGGWWAMAWNITNDPDRADPFHDATKGLLDGPSSPSRKREGDTPFGLDKKNRLAALERTQAFDKVEHMVQSWSLSLDPD